MQNNDLQQNKKVDIILKLKKKLWGWDMKVKIVMENIYWGCLMKF